MVTLVREEGTRCWGTAYRVHAAERDAVLEALDVREQGGYERVETPVHFDDEATDTASATLWIATPRNHNYLGPATSEAIARQVQSSHGPSGPNPEYVLRLAEALRAMGAHDGHVFEIEALVRRYRSGS